MKISFVSNNNCSYSWKFKRGKWQVYKFERKFRRDGISKRNLFQTEFYGFELENLCYPKVESISVVHSLKAIPPVLHLFHVKELITTLTYYSHNLMNVSKERPDY